jgi:hypothetical protein
MPIGNNPKSGYVASNKTIYFKPRKPGNINISKLPLITNPDGTESSIRTISVNIDGKEVLLPTVINGQLVSEKAAVDHFKQTGEHLGIFDSPEAATLYAENLHELEQKRSMDEFTKKRIKIMQELERKYPKGSYIDPNQESYDFLDKVRAKYGEK